MKIKNTLSKQLEPLITLEEGKVKLYSCGPTVYNYAHIGNLRAFLFADTLKRALLWLGFEVFHIMNITDVDDKIIRDSQAQGKSREEFSSYYEKAFLDDLESLNVLPADKFPRATEYVDKMQSLIQSLLDKELAYVGNDGSIYFSVMKFPNYGKLAHIDRKKLQSGASGRVKKDEYTKDEAHDFALWKSYEDSDGDVFWEPQFTVNGTEQKIKGRPGWHIECSAMSTALLGDSFDIHTGGIDLVFPHHENEIAQSEGATDKPFVKYWMHNEHLLVDGGKMSKSLGNFYTLRDLVDKGFDPIAFRLLSLQAHYASKLNFTLESLQASTHSLERLNDFVLRMQELADNNVNVSDQDMDEKIDIANRRIKFALENDLDTPAALEVLFSFVKDAYAAIEGLSSEDASKILQFLERLNKFLGVLSFEQEPLPKEVADMIKEREQARADKDWTKSDELRDAISKAGFTIEDTSSGTRWKRKKQ